MSRQNKVAWVTLQRDKNTNRMSVNWIILDITWIFWPKCMVGLDSLGHKEFSDVQCCMISDYCLSTIFKFCPKMVSEKCRVIKLKKKNLYFFSFFLFFSFFYSFHQIFPKFVSGHLQTVQAKSYQKLFDLPNHSHVMHQWIQHNETRLDLRLYFRNALVNWHEIYTCALSTMFWKLQSNLCHLLVKSHTHL